MTEFKCPQCVAKDFVSVVHLQGSASTSLYFERFFDTEGRAHFHDGNQESVQYWCSNGHSGVAQIAHECWCGWKQHIARLVAFRTEGRD